MGFSVSVVIPAYNEEAAIGPDLDVIMAAMKASGYEFQVIVVDDGSRDRTAAIAAAKGAQVIRHAVNKGSGAARRTGIRAACGDVVVMTDADGTYPNQDIPRLLSYLPAADQVIGARTTEKGSLRWLRAPTKWFIRQLASYLMGCEIPDLNSGLRAFKRDTMLKYLHLLPNGFSCVSTMSLAFLGDGLNVQFVPIDYYPRVGQSKFHPVRDTYNYLVTVVRMVMYFEPLKVFLPSALVLLLVGLAKLFYDMYTRQNMFYVPGVTLLLIFVALQIGAIGLLADLIVRRSK